MAEILLRAVSPPVGENIQKSTLSTETVVIILRLTDLEINHACMRGVTYSLLDMFL